MKRILTLILFTFSVCTYSYALTDESTIEKDLRDEWMLFKDGEYQSISTGAEFKSKVIYLHLNLSAKSNSYLQVSSTNLFSVFVDGLLTEEASTHKLISLDSIRQHRGTSAVTVAIFQSIGIEEEHLQTSFVTKIENKVGGVEIISRSPTYFRDFIVTGVLFLLILLILVIRQNPKLAGDYLSLQKLFSTSTSQDSLGDTRTNSSSNILFQVFCSILFGFLFTILTTYLRSDYRIATLFTHTTYIEVLWIWLMLSVLIFVLLLFKQLVIYIFAFLFGIKELAAPHYFNLIRLLFWVLGISGVFVAIYLLAHGEQVIVFRNLYFLLAWSLGISLVIIFFKLSRRVSFSMFHLFSYLCATEIIPLIITIKVLYY